MGCGSSPAGSTGLPSGSSRGTDTWRTATWALRLRADHTLPRRTDLWLDAAGTDLTVRFVRVLRVTQPSPAR